MAAIAKPETAQALVALREILVEGSIRAGVQADAVCGVVPQLYAEPGDEVELSRVLRYANECGLQVCPCGGGSKLDWGTAPPAIDLMISTACFNLILEYAPDDMTVTAGAGVTVAQLESTLAARRQRLALDPLWPERATVGGVIATNDSGALRLRYGGMRDLIIGVTVVLPDGTVASSGGKVVKNVAGYDLPKLMTGSLGTLGIITRAVFRLHPLPERSQTLSWSFANANSANDFILAIADSLVVSSGLQMRCNSSGEVQVDVRIDGVERSIAEQFESVRKLAGDAGCEPAGDPWQQREQLWAGSDAAKTLNVKLSILPDRLAATANFLRKEHGDAYWRLLMYSSGLGWLRIDSAEYARTAELLSSLRMFVASSEGTAVVLQAPAEVRQSVDVWGEAGAAFALMKSIKDRFDPKGILNRGRFVGGI